MEKAGFLRRFIAHLIDETVTGVAAGIIVFPMWKEGQYIQIVLISITLYLLYGTLMEHSMFQGTIGKMLLGIKVVDIKGNRISLLQAFKRNFGKYISQIFFNVPFLLILVNGNSKHDMYSNCTVILRNQAAAENRATIKFLWTWSGRFLGYAEDKFIWTWDGKYVGELNENKEIFSPDGVYIGEIYKENGRLVTDTKKSDIKYSTLAAKENRNSMGKKLDNESSLFMYTGYRDFPKMEG